MTQDIRTIRIATQGPAGPAGIGNVFEAASQADMLALAAQKGDLALRSDVSQSFVLAAEPASTLVNWKELLTPAGGGSGVTSVAGLTGVIAGSDLKSALAIAASDVSGLGALAALGVGAGLASAGGNLAANVQSVASLTGAITAGSLTAALDAMVGDSGSGGAKGLVPAPVSGDAAAGKFLKADGTWASLPSGDMSAATYDPAGIGEQLVGLTATQTLANKTLTAPAITSPTGIAASDVSGLAASATIDATDAGNIGSGTLADARLSANQRAASIEFVIDGAGAAITSDMKGYLTVAFDCTITEVTLLADQSGSIEIDIWKCAYADFDASATHPVAGDSITAGAKPTLSSAVKAQDTTLTGWTTAVSAGDILAFNVDSATTVQRVTLALKVTKG